MSTALPGHVVEMMDADALEPVDDLIDDIGRNKFSKTALSEGKKDGTCYSLPLYSHAQVMWYRKDLQKMVFMVVLSRVVQMTLWQLDF